MKHAFIFKETNQTRQKQKEISAFFHCFVVSFQKFYLKVKKFIFLKSMSVPVSWPQTRNYELSPVPAADFPLGVMKSSSLYMTLLLLELDSGVVLVS